MVFPKGKVDEGEDSLEAALRETYEETHLEIAPQNVNKNQFILMETSKN